jgi:hypothetical protein
MNKKLNLHLLILVCVLAWLLPAGLAKAQVSTERFDRFLEQFEQENRLRVDPNVPENQRAYMDFGGFTTFNYFMVQDGVQYTNLRQYDLNGYGRLNIDGVHDFFVRARTSYRDFDPGDSFDGRGDQWIEPTVDRAFYKFDLARAMQAYEGQRVDYNVVAVAGRQLINWGNGVAFNQEIDGGRFQFTYDKVTLEAMVGMTRDSTIDIDTSRPGFNSQTNRLFYGGMITTDFSAFFQPYVYGLVQEDYNRPSVLTATVPGVGVTTTNYNFNSYYIGGGWRSALSDRIVFSSEFVYQGGRNLTNSFTVVPPAPITQSFVDISAFAGDVQLDYMFGDDNNTRATGEVIFATGNEDRLHTTNTFGGTTPASTDTSYNGFGLLNTGLAFAPNVSNLVVYRGGVSTFPFVSTKWLQRFQFGTDILVFTKFDQSAPIDQPSENSYYLGFETDFYINWQITSDLTFGMRYGLFVPGQELNNNKELRQFLYTGLTLSF